MEQDSDFETLLNYLKQHRSCDFAAYKRSSLLRRIYKRMHTLHIKDVKEYSDYLAGTPDELVHLFNTILINVTAFFRDQPAWTALHETILPRLLADKPPAQPVRVWSAGCASGEEAYSLAMLLAEILGREAFRERVKIYATDLDEEGLAQARRAVYRSRDLLNVPPPLRNRYFEPLGERFLVRSELRQAVIFGCHDITRDAPISNLDLLVCRNTLMYFNVETQQRILSRFNYALRESGVLFLGKAEMLLTHTRLFTPLEISHRIFTKVPQPRHALVTKPGHQDEVVEDRFPQPLLEAAFDILPLAQLIADHNGNLVAANAQARLNFALSDDDLGQPLHNHELFYRPLELRTHIERCQREHCAVTINDVLSQSGHEPQYWEVQVMPLLDEGGNHRGISITYADVSCYHQWQRNANESIRKLQSANENLETTQEELTTANEELLIANEELLIANEELRSINEELGRLNEMNHSTHQELDTINEELHRRTEKLDRANSFLQGLLKSLPVGVIEVDNQYRVLLWNEKAEHLLALLVREGGAQCSPKLDVGVSLEQVQPYLRRSIADAKDPQEVTLDIPCGGRALRITVHSEKDPDVAEPDGLIVVLQEISHDV